MENRYLGNTLMVVKVLVGISLACLLAALFLPARVKTLHDFLVGAATGMLLVTFATLLTKGEVKAHESEIQSLRLDG